jgi:hypothetical protein
LILLLVPTVFAQAAFPAFWNKYESAVASNDKAAVAEMTKFPVSMPYLVKAVKNKPEFLRRYDEISKARRMPLNVLEAPNRENRPGAMRSTALSRKPPRLKTPLFAFYSN